MSLNIRAFAYAAGATAAVLFVICAAGVALAPEFMTRTASFLVHMDLTGMARTVTPTNFVGGLAVWTLGTALAFGFAAWVYNRTLGPGTENSRP